MAGINFVAVPDSSTTASFRDWTLKTHNAILACGFVDVSSSNGSANTAGRDTVITFSVVNPPTGANDTRGYKVYAFNDAQQASASLFFKVEYGSGNGTGVSGIFLTTATAHNSSGAMAGDVTRRFQCYWEQVTAGSGRRSVWLMGGDATGSDPYISFAGSMCYFDSSIAQTGTPSFFAIERTKDNSGVATAEGYVCLRVLMNGPTYDLGQAAISGGVTLGAAAWPIGVNLSNPSTDKGKLVMCAPQPDAFIVRNPCTAVLSVKNAYLRDFDTFRADVYPGVFHTYIKLGNVTTLGTNQSTNNAAMRYD